MTVRVGPFYYAPEEVEDDPGVLTSDWTRMARSFGGVDINSGVVGHAGGNVAKVYADASGRLVKVMPGYVLLQGSYRYWDTTENVSIAANTSGNPRIDLIVVRKSPEDRTVTLEVIQGTPGASPTEPTETVTDLGIYEVPLAAVRVENGAAVITADKVRERRLFRPHMIDTGMSMWWAGQLNKAPAGFLPHSLTPVSRDTYHRLFTAIGTTWGPGDNSTTFHLPPPGHVPVTVHPTIPQFSTPGGTVGSPTHQLSVPELPNHAMPFSVPDRSVHHPEHNKFGVENGPNSLTPNEGQRYLLDPNDGAGNSNGSSSAGGPMTLTVPGFSGSTGAIGENRAHNNLQPTMVGYWLIKT